ncbi:MAG: DegT/DnrJ/EryC1/StrS family aminotransferase [Thermodesulforhabdaceae bacterium]
MITDLLIAPDIAVDSCIGETDDAISRTFSKAQTEGVKTWLYVGSVDRIHSELAEKLMNLKLLSKEEASVNASRLLKDFSSRHSWLAALTEDGEAVTDPFPLRSQLSKAVNRLGQGAYILTRSEDFLKDPSIKSISPEDYLVTLSSAPPEIPFVDLYRQQDLIRGEIERRIFTVLRHCRYVGGPEIAELEERLKDEVGVQHAITCSSGTDALFMSLLALGIGPGDAVFTVPFTFAATAEVIRLAGATPVFVDIDPVCFVMDPESLRKAIEAVEGKRRDVPLPRGADKLKPKAIIAVDLFGCPAPYKEISRIAHQYGLFLIEDAAQAFGSRYGKKMAGSLGNVGCVSFFPAKSLGAYGDGGAIFTDSEELAERLRLIRNHGTDSVPYQHRIIGLNGRLDSIQAAVLLAKLKIFGAEKRQRQHIADLYTEKLSGIPGIITPTTPESVESVWSQYSILTPSRIFRDTLRKELAENRIPTAIYYPLPLHLQPAFEDLGYKSGDFPVAESCAERILSLPIHPYVKKEVIEKVVEIAARVNRNRKGCDHEAVGSYCLS